VAYSGLEGTKAIGTTEFPYPLQRNGSSCFRGSMALSDMSGTLADPSESGDELIARTDAPMYEAKRTRRNKVVSVPIRAR